MMECWNSGIMGSGIMQCWVDGKICVDEKVKKPGPENQVFNIRIKNGFLPLKPTFQYSTIPLFHGRGIERRPQNIPHIFIKL